MSYCLNCVTYCEIIDSFVEVRKFVVLWPFSDENGIVVSCVNSYYWCYLKPITSLCLNSGIHYGKMEKLQWHVTIFSIIPNGSLQRSSLSKELVLWNVALSTLEHICHRFKLLCFSTFLRFILRILHVHHTHTHTTSTSCVSALNICWLCNFYRDVLAMRQFQTAKQRWKDLKVFEVFGLFFQSLFNVRKG